MEMKNICGKIPVELHEKLKLEVEELGISIPKYLEMVIEEHMTRKGEKTNMADLRTVAVQVTEDLFSRLKAVLPRNGMKKKEDPAPPAPAGPTQEELLAEIRDLLKNKS